MIEKHRIRIDQRNGVMDVTQRKTQCKNGVGLNKGRLVSLAYRLLRLLGILKRITA